MLKRTIVMVACVAMTTPALARDFTLDFLPQTQQGFFLKSACGGSTYFTFVRESLAPTLKKFAPPGFQDEESALKAGKGIQVKLDDHNYNYHVSYTDDPQSGRSYGWTDNKVGDWSDVAYLNSLAKIVGSSEDDLGAFYSTLVQLLGKCDSSGLADMLKNNDLERTEVNFLAIYTAEAYRHSLNNSNWDDAILEVTLLGAFHGGQKKLMKFYGGQFSPTAVDQNACVYTKPAERAKAPRRAARLNDYWQPGTTAVIKNGRCTGRSGINKSRPDFDAMGRAITAYERNTAKNKNLGSIEAIVGKSSNVIKAISVYFANGKADVTQTDNLANLVASFLLQVRADAQNITDSLK